MDKDKLDQWLRGQTKEAIAVSRRKWKERVDNKPKQETWSIDFLGTGGNPEAVIGQRPRTAGFILKLGEFFLYVDPGPNALHGVLEGGHDVGELDAIYISHGHVDHYSGAEGIIEGMCWAMSARRGKILAPYRVLQEEKLISEFHLGDTQKSGYVGGPEVLYIKDRESISLAPNLTLTPIRAYHGSENYGFIIDAGGFTVGYTSDTNYIRTYRTKQGIAEVQPFGALMDIEEIVSYREDIKETFSKVDVLIANVTSHNAFVHRHITTIGLAHLLTGSKVKQCYLSHFNYCCIEPIDLRDAMAEYVESVSGVKCLPARDQMRVDLSLFVKED